MNNQPNEPRLISEIAKEIQQTWKNVNPAAVPYLAAMRTIHSNQPTASYYAEDAKSVILYFLSNASTWRGEDAKRIKAELKTIVNLK